jgi:hypothetical protein
MDGSMTDPNSSPLDPTLVRYLRRLVSILSITMIAGILVIMGLLVSRYMQEKPHLPDRITLPEGKRAIAYTEGRGWFAVVTEDNEILIFDGTTADLRKTIRID